jgi:peptidoglycan/xylan/chitin deacetylase (PgdA/CDA1 family)
LTLQHHYFCSHFCFIKFKYKDIKKVLIAKKNLLFIATQILLLLFIVFQFFYFHNKLNNFRPSFPIATRDTVFLPAIKSYLNNFNIEFQRDQVQFSGKRIQNLYTLNLSLKKGWMLNLWKNNQAQISELMKSDNFYAFSIPLDYGTNKLQILVIDQNQNLVFKDELKVDYYKPFVEAFRHSVNLGNTSEKMLALTFDGGSSANHTAQILSMLKENEITCTMFLTGKFMEQNPDIVKQILNEGHEIANHTYDHPHLTTYAKNQLHENEIYVDFDYLRKQLFKTDSIFYKISGEHIKPYWRAPFGEYNKQILTWAAELGYLHIRWTSGFDTFDWVVDESSKLYRTPQVFMESIIEKEKNRETGLNGIIVLMHLGSLRNQDHIFESLPDLINYTLNNGYALVSISDLLKN